MLENKRLEPIIGGLLFAWSASAVAAPLKMICHELIQGRPDPDGNTYVLDGDVLTNHAFDQVTVISTSKPTLLQRYPSEHSSSWAVHRVFGHKVFRTTYWKTDAGRITRSFHDVFDFDAQTERDGLDGGRDVCHHNGR